MFQQGNGQSRESVATTIGAPTGGWNARDPLPSMAANDAVELVNVFPDQARVKLRNGYSQHSTGMGSGDVETLAELSLPAGTRKLVAGANGNIYDASSATASSLASGFSSNQWQTTHFKDRLFLVNGTDAPQTYDGSTCGASGWTGTGLTASDLINCSSFGTRFIGVEKNSTSFWYGASGAVTGALTEFNLDNIFQKGGYLLYAGAATRDSGDGLNDNFIAVSSMGEIVVYQGDPGGTFTRVGQFQLHAEPLGYRSVFRYERDLAVITENGVFRVNDVLGGDVTANNALSDKIQDKFRESASMYSSNFGWSGVVYPKGKMCVINIPVNASSNYDQYVVNTVTGAWCKFDGLNGVSWATYNGNLYFGGTDGKVYKADDGDDDNGSEITFNIEMAYNYFGDPGTRKLFTMVRPFLQASSSEVDFAFGVNVDYGRTANVTGVTASGSAGSAWDSATWDSADWSDADIPLANWYTIGGLGYAGSIVIRGNHKDISWSMAAVSVLVTPGGTL